MHNIADEAGRPSGHTLREFWTTGTIARLCDGITRLSGFVVQLRDERGGVLDSSNVNQEARSLIPDDEPLSVHSIHLDQDIIGSIVVLRTHTSNNTDASTVLIEEIAADLAQTVSEICTNMTQLRYRVEEVGVLYKLSSLLVQGGRVKDMLTLTLELAIEVLELDAGAIMLLPEDSAGIVRRDMEHELERSASYKLSDDWLGNPVPLSIDREFDQACLSGEVVASEDLSEDTRVLVPDQCRDEGLVAFLGAGMVFNGRPIGVIRLYSHQPRVFSSADRDLIRSIGESAAAAVEQARLLKTKALQRRTQRSLRIAGAVQKKMLPDRIPEFETLDLAARYRPSQEIGGDFYDLFPVRDQLGVLVGDVVGKGVVAGLLMSAVRATLRAYAELSDDISRVMIRTNDAVYRDTTVSEFVTIFYGMIDPDSLKLNYVNAGHEPPVILRKVNGDWRFMPLEGSGLVVGVIENEEYQMYEMQLEKGDYFIAYTDGITDAIDFENNRFRRARLEESVLEYLNECHDVSANELLERIFWSLRQFSGLQEQADDETLVVIKVNHESS